MANFGTAAACTKTSLETSLTRLKTHKNYQRPQSGDAAAVLCFLAAVQEWVPNRAQRNSTASGAGTAQDEGQRSKNRSPYNVGALTVGMGFCGHIAVSFS